MMQLNDYNYYSTQANMEYMSASQYKSFRKCEAAAMADLRGEYERKKTTALLVGSYVDAYFSGELDMFKRKNPEIFKKDGTLNAEFQQAQTIAERLARDELARMLLSGAHQVIKTGQIAGVWFKAKYDSLLEEDQVDEICRKFPKVRELVPFGGGIIVDLKCMRDFEPIWDEDAYEKVSFATYWGYDIQGAIYQMLDGRHAPFTIVGVTKEAEPNIEAFHIPDEELAFAMLGIEQLAPRYAAIKRGEIEPKACGKCEYCRSRKKLTGFRDYREV